MCRYLSIYDVTEGMVLAAPMRLGEGGVLRYLLPAGHALTGDNLRQLQAHHAEFVPVNVDDPRSDEQRVQDVQAAERRLREIFSLVDTPSAAQADLYAAVLAYRKAQ